MKQKHQEKSRGMEMNGFMLTRAYFSRKQRVSISLVLRSRNRLLHVCTRTTDGSCGFLKLYSSTNHKKRNNQKKKKSPKQPNNNNNKNHHGKKAYLTLRFQVLIKINALVRKVLNDQLSSYFVYIARQVLNICCIMLSILSFEQDKLCTTDTLGLQ